MCRFIILGIVLFSLNAGAQTTPGRLWVDLKAKRDNLASIHQEFEVTSTHENGHDRQTRHWELEVDMSRGRWRERSVTGFFVPVRVFDGKDVLSFEDGEKEYVRAKGGDKNNLPLPSPYRFDELEWSKAIERQRLPCGLQYQDHPCVVLEIPIKNWMRLSTNGHTTRLVDGVVQVVLDMENGLLMQSRTVQLIQSESCSCRSDVSYLAKNETYRRAPDDSLFVLPSTNTRQVKELPRWNAARIKNDLGGKLAPELIATDLTGTPVTLAALRGKTVLLDFWASWCPPCRKDAPAIQKLYQKYGNRELAIVGIAVSEDRKTVEKFLKEHSAGYPVVLSTESDLPRPYQASGIPTYIVIDPSGKVQAATEGDQGFSELRSMLKNAGLDTD